MSTGNRYVQERVVITSRPEGNFYPSETVYGGRYIYIAFPSTQD